MSQLASSTRFSSAPIVEKILRDSVRQACLFAKERSDVQILPDENRVAKRDLAEEVALAPFRDSSKLEHGDFGGWLCLTLPGILTRGQVAERAMGSTLIVVLQPLIREPLHLSDRVEDVSVQHSLAVRPTRSM